MNVPPQPLLKAKNLSVSIGNSPQFRICNQLNFSLAAGERLAILGRNGAGKSTLLSVLSGLRSPDAGEVLLGGTAYARLSPRAAALRRGWLAQRHSDPFSATVLETALTGRHPHLDRWDWESTHDTEIARAALNAVGLADLETRDVQTLSGGERQRLAVATLLTQAPPLYLLDEPLAHLDLNHQIGVLDVFTRIAENEDGGVIMVLHEPGLADRYCQRALLVYGDGQCEIGDCRELLSVERLGRLYGHPLRQVETNRGRWFIPE